VIGLLACGEEAELSDAYGNFEATTLVVSAEANGQLLLFDVNEGKTLAANQLVALVDTVDLHLQRRQLEANLGVLPQKLRNSLADIQVLEDQKANLVRERDRVSRLLEKKAATPKQLDDLNGQITVTEQQVQALRANTQTANRSIMAEKGPLLAQIDVIEEQIRKAYVYNPVAGTVLTKLVEPAELVGRGTPLYRLGVLDTMTLRVYLSELQLQTARLGQVVEVLVDDGAEGYRQLSGTISWIADQAEFTPKTIQTKADRVNLVYAVKVRVPNPDGQLKIGMPAEMNFTASPGSTTAATE
jgi:HlyD family secretion protein